MSRIGNKHITVPAGVTVVPNGNVCKITGPKGSLDVIINHGITISLEGDTLICKRESDEKQVKQNHGTTRANINNAIIGVTKGYKKSLEMRGIGYKMAMKGQSVEIWAGYSHTVVIAPLPGVKITLPSPTEADVEGIDKQAVGQTAALIREVRSPEPYLGKGIRYKDEYVATKEGKRASAAKK